MRLLLCFAALCSPLAVHGQTFTDVSDLLPASSQPNGDGAAVADIDNDGRFDLAGPREIYLRRDEGFSVIPLRGNVPIGSVFGDVDNDGRPEAFVLDGFAPFIDAYDLARESLRPLDGGISTGPDLSLTQGSILFDYDRDGALDALIGNDGGVDILFRGDGDGTFTDVSDETMPQIERGDYGMMAADYDRDGDDDVYVGLCFGVLENLLYRNDNGVFSEVALSADVADARASWGVVWFDFDNDGWLDLFVANMPTSQSSDGSNGLFRNNGDGTFTDVAAAAGVAGPADESGWNATVADFDNDGWQDLFVANQPGPSRLYRNNADGTFSDITAESGLPTLNGVEVTSGDVDRDGWPDLYVPDLLFYNDGGTNGWLSVDLTGTASNRDGIGARVEVTAGNLQMVREITAGGGFVSQSHGLHAHFGLGTATSADITVRWPSGAVETIMGVAANQRITVVEGLGLNQPPAMFGLTSPADEAVVPLGEAVTLAWEAATDPEGEAVSYTVYLAAPDGTDQTFETTEPTLTVAASALVTEGTYRWAVVATDGYTPRTSLGAFGFTNNPDVASESVPERAALTVEVWPNPARGVPTVQVDLPVAQTLVLEVFDALGRQVRSLDLGPRGAGQHAERLDVSDFGAGVYVVRVSGSRGGQASTRLVRAVR
ncbi:MAG: FG-GAP-like repeat-containing protein [Bacteroidota bacterium]